MKKGLKITPFASTPFTIKFSLLLIVLYYFLVPLVLFAPVVIARLFDYPLAEMMGLRKETAFYFFIGSQAIGMVISFLLLRRQLKEKGETWHALGIRRFQKWRALKMILAFPLFFLLLIIVVAIIAGALGIEPPPPEAAKESRQRMLESGILAAFIFGVLFAPVMEEIFFRGMLLPALARKVGLVAGILISSLIFSAAHLNPAQILATLIVGPYLSWMYYRLGSIIPGMILHALWNAMVLSITVGGM